MKNSSRRDFLRLGARTLAGAGLALGTNPLHTLARAAETGYDANDYRALVCIYLDGGSDGFSLLVPGESGLYNEYANARQHLAVDNGSLLSLNDAGGNNPACKLNAVAQALEPVYSSGDLAFVSNVGTLVEPTSKQQYEENAVQLPDQLFSHSDQSIQWQQQQGAGVDRNGWGAIAADYLSGGQGNTKLTSIAIDGSNYWQSSTFRRPFGMQAQGLVRYAGMDDPSSSWQAPRREAFEAVLQQNYDHLFMRAYADLQNQAIEITKDIGHAIASSSPITTPRPGDNHLVDQLAMAAKLINVRAELGMSRQIFFVRMGGWDVHDHQNNEMPDLLTGLGDAMAWFSAVMQEFGVNDQVTTFTASDFGRTLTGNGDGTDHGWGNHHMVMGGAVQGGQIYGQLPRMLVDGPDDVHHGRVLPTLSTSEYAATLLSWLGLDDAALDQTLPMLKNFNSRNIGFMG